MFRSLLSSNRWVAPRYLQAKPVLRVLILGSYSTRALKTLEMLRDFLLAKGYVQTRLVKEFRFPKRNSGESRSAYNLRKSEYWIPKADVLVFVFCSNADNTGPAYELKHLIDIHCDMTWRCIVGISEPAPSISSLIYGLVDRWSREFQQVFFKTDAVLQEDVKGALTNLLERLYFLTINRQESEWELFG
jgi:hypothetical protein